MEKRVNIFHVFCAINVSSKEGLVLAFGIMEDIYGHLSFMIHGNRSFFIWMRFLVYVYIAR